MRGVDVVPLRERRVVLEDGVAAAEGVVGQREMVRRGLGRCRGCPGLGAADEGDGPGGRDVGDVCVASRSGRRSSRPAGPPPLRPRRARNGRHEGSMDHWAVVEDDASRRVVASSRVARDGDAEDGGSREGRLVTQAGSATFGAVVAEEGPRRRRAWLRGRRARGPRGRASGTRRASARASIHRPAAPDVRAMASGTVEGRPRVRHRADRGESAGTAAQAPPVAMVSGEERRVRRRTTGGSRRWTCRATGLGSTGGPSNRACGRRRGWRR
jgi:hypothetical protein